MTFDIEFFARLFAFFIPFLFALCFHEFAHGWAAKRLGDDTATLMGRLTLNPIAHMDVIGTLVLPIVMFATGVPWLFGWAKPVPVNPRNLKNPRRDMFWIAAAGPLSNILLALVGTLGFIIALKFDPQLWIRQGMGAELVQMFIAINLVLAVFNLIPIHPLDGGKVLARFLPEDLNRKLEDNQQILGIILMVLIFSGLIRYITWPVGVALRFLINFAQVAAL